MILILLFAVINAQRNNNTVDCDASGSDGSYTEILLNNDRIRNIQSSGCPTVNIDNVCNVDTSSQRGVKRIMNKDINISSYPLICDTTDEGEAFIYGMGITFDGVSIYRGGNCPVNLTEYNSSLCFDPLIEESFDCCNGHPDATGQYHYHSTPHCLLDNIGDRDNNNGHSKQIGWAFDGFPIYGPYGIGYNKLIYPCTHPNADINDCLDECNGHMHHNIDGFKYHYHFGGTNGSEQYPDISQRPYSIACFKGMPIWDSISYTGDQYQDTRTCTISGVTHNYQPIIKQGVTSQDSQQTVSGNRRLLNMFYSLINY